MIALAFLSAVGAGAAIGSVFRALAENRNRAAYCYTGLFLMCLVAYGVTA